MRQSLRALLEASHELAIVASSGDGLSALCQVREHQPGLLIIDLNLLEEEVEALVAAVKTEQPTLCCLVFVQSRQQERQILAAGVDAVAQRNDLPQKLQRLWARLTQEMRDRQD